MEISQASQRVLRDHYQILESSLDAQALSGALFSKGLITLELNEELSLVHTTRTQKNGILLRYLLRNPSPNLIPQLCEILSAEEANKHLASSLKEAFGRQETEKAPVQATDDVSAEEDVLDTKPNLSQLMEHVYPVITVKWFEIGIHLGIDDRELELIENNRRKVQEMCMDMLRFWMKKNKHGSKSTSWRVLFSGLRKAQEVGLADELEEKLRNGQLDD